MTISADNPQTCDAVCSPVQGEVPLTTAEMEDILQLQQAIFARVASNANDYQSILSKLCELAESLLPNSVASIMMLDPETGLMNVLCAPSVPQVGIDALQGLKPGATGGSCGNAVFGNTPVYVQDTFTDPRWESIRQIALDFNLCSCWSNPIRNEQELAIGSFALSSFEHRAPTEFHKRILEVGASMIRIVLSHRAQNERLEENRRRLELMGTALSQSTEGVIITDSQNRIAETNQAFEAITGYRSDEVLGQNPSVLSSGKQDKMFYTRMWDSLNSNGHWHGEIVNRRKDGSLISQWMSLNAIRNTEGELQNYVAVFTDLTELKAEREKRLYALEHDQLTGLPNKSRLSFLLDDAEQGGSLLLLNVDNFSYINTAYGLAFGDQLLCGVAERLQQLSVDARAFRVNADEFALYFDGKVDLEAQIAQVRQLFARQIEVEDLGFNITFTFGGASGHQGLFGQAIQALRKAREQGKNRFHLYDAQQDEPDQDKRFDYIHWNSLLHAALSEDRVRPYFQGIRDNQSGEITRYEALVRLEHEGEVYTPYRFLNAARLSGLMPEIARRVIDKGFAEIAGKSCLLSVNITEEDLNQGYLAAYLDEKSAQYGVEPSRVTLEILEGVSATGKKNHIKQLSALKQRGYQLAIDDFGTEYSNFERILELNVDTVKIDAKYIKNIAEDKTSYEVTRAIVFFAKNAGIETVAEFVHNEAVQAIVSDLGIEYSQGYLFSEPAPSI